MNGAIVTTETLSIVDGVMMEDKVCNDLQSFLAAGEFSSVFRSRSRDLENVRMHPADLKYRHKLEGHHSISFLFCNGWLAWWRMVGA